jgi:hypothetical protein
MDTSYSQLLPAIHHDNLQFAESGESSFMGRYSNDLRARKGKDLALGPVTNGLASTVSSIVEYAVNQGLTALST